MNTRTWTKYGHILKVQIQNQMTYRGDLAGRSLAIVLFMWVFFQLWRATYSAAGGQQTSIAGLSLRDTLWYLMLAEAVVLSRNNIWRPISEAVKDGSVAYMLNKPYSFLLYHASTSIGDAASQFLFNVLSGGLVVWLLVGPPPEPLGWPATILVVLMAFLIDYSISALIGLAAFITEEVAAFNWIYMKFLLLLGGVLIPLDFFPGWLQQTARVLPFAYTIYGPARFFIEPTSDRFLGLFTGQIVWLAALSGLLFFVYGRSVRRLNINGG